MILLFWLIGLIFVALAIPLLGRKVGPNHLYGLRVAETLENEAVWYEANARSAKDLLWVGVLGYAVKGVRTARSSVSWTAPGQARLHNGKSQP